MRSAQAVTDERRTQAARAAVLVDVHAEVAGGGEVTGGVVDEQAAPRRDAGRFGHRAARSPALAGCLQLQAGRCTLPVWRH